jgi:hypothetical protein
MSQKTIFVPRPPSPIQDNAIEDLLCAIIDGDPDGNYDSPTRVPGGWEINQLTDPGKYDMIAPALGTVKEMMSVISQIKNKRA